MALWFQNKIVNESAPQGNPSLIRATYEDWLSFDYSKHERLAFWYDKKVSDMTKRRSVA